jgi:hypothetical protein
MTTNLSTGMNRPGLPSLADIERHMTELLSVQNNHQPHKQPNPTPQSAPVPREFASPKLPGAALHGVAGLAVRTIAPHTEAHPASILLQLLVAFGNLVGRGPHCTVDATRHGLNLFLVLVGDSGKARKGTSWAQIARLFAEVDQPWLSSCVNRARLTPNGLLFALRDQQPATDRRFLALSEEFASVLHALKRGSGHLSPLLRCAWDDGNLPTLDMQRHLQATGTHISMIAHITHSELTPGLNPTETYNGFANRCLWAVVERSNCLPEGGNLSAGELSGVAREIRRALDWANANPETIFRRDSAAAELWREHYPALSQLRPGLRGAATSRAEAQVLRLSAIYAALESSSIIQLPHLQAALAVWGYCYASASLLFGVSTGDPIADRIREAVEASDTGLSKSQIRRLFHGHVDGYRIDGALETLVALGALSPRSEPTGGRPSTLWSAFQDENFQDIEELLAADEEWAEKD